jgi:hypothetical protein
VTQGVEEVICLNPASLLDQLGVHDGEMSGRASEADPTQFPPEFERLA